MDWAIGPAAEQEDPNRCQDAGRGDYSHREVGARRRLWRGADVSAIFGVLASGGDGMGESGSGRSAARCPVGLEDKVGDAGPSESSVSSRGGTLLQSFPDHLVRQDLDDRLRQGIGVAGRNE